MSVFVELNDDGDYINITADWRYKELCKSIPGATWHAKSDCWRLPVSWSGCLALRSTFTTSLEIGPKLQAWAFNELETRINPANELREALDGTTTHDTSDLLPHQKGGIAFLASARQAIIADEPGLGKTVQAIRTLKELEARNETVFPALIVCPNTIKLNWKKEFQKWWPEKADKVVVIHGTAAQRRKQFETYFTPKEGEVVPEIFIINWESIRSHSRLQAFGGKALIRCKDCGGLDESISATRCEVHILELNRIDFNTVIADEAHRAMNPQSKQTRALWAASGAAEFRYALTGTPIAKDVVDLWAILHWLNPKEWPTRSKWIDRMIETMQNAFGGLIVLGIRKGMENEFFAALNPRMRRMLKAVVLPWLPELVYIQKDVDMSAKQAKAYKQMLDTCIAEVEDEEIITAASGLTQATRLLQLAASYGTVEVDPWSGESTFKMTDPSAKLDALMDDILEGDFGEESVAITAVSKQLINLLSARLKKAKIEHGLITGDQSAVERQWAIDDFQSGKTKFILFTAQAGGVGVTLTKARYLVRLQRPWSLVDDIQVRDRVHRIGSEQHSSVIIVDYVTWGTIEERVQDVLDNKGVNFEEIVKDKEQLLKTLKGES